MIDRFTSRIRTAQSRTTTGIATFIRDACQIEGAFGANGTLGATIWWAAQEGG